MLDYILMSGISRKRPHGGEGENAYRATIAEALAPWGPTLDPCGNLWVDRGGDTVWTAHLDTVHRADGGNSYTAERGMLSAAGDVPLGADDAAGCAVLCQLIADGVPGLYLFTVGEEAGGVGASYLARHYAPTLRRYARAIAVDRRGQHDICGSQGGRTLASHAYVEALAGQLGMGHTWADGVYTDNREFAGLIPNIVNISAGYEHEHTDAETLDLGYLRHLAWALAWVDWEALPAEGPGPEETMDDWQGWGLLEHSQDDLMDLAERMARDLGGILDPMDLLPYLEDAHDLGQQPKGVSPWT